MTLLVKGELHLLLLEPCHWCVQGTVVGHCSSADIMPVADVRLCVHQQFASVLAMLLGVRPLAVSHVSVQLRLLVVCGIFCAAKTFSGLYNRTQSYPQ